MQMRNFEGAGARVVSPPLTVLQLSQLAAPRISDEATQPGGYVRVIDRRAWIDMASANAVHDALVTQAAASDLRRWAERFASAGRTMPVDYYV